MNTGYLIGYIDAGQNKGVKLNATKTWHIHAIPVSSENARVGWNYSWQVNKRLEWAPPVPAAPAPPLSSCWMSSETNAICIWMTEPGLGTVQVRGGVTQANCVNHFLSGCHPGWFMSPSPEDQHTGAANKGDPCWLICIKNWLFCAACTHCVVLSLIVPSHASYQDL